MCQSVLQRAWAFAESSRQTLKKHSRGMQLASDFCKLEAVGNQHFVTFSIAPALEGLLQIEAEPAS